MWPRVLVRVPAGKERFSGLQVPLLAKSLPASAGLGGSGGAARRVRRAQEGRNTQPASGVPQEPCPEENKGTSSPLSHLALLQPSRRIRDV